MWVIHSPDGAAQYLDIILMDSICYEAEVCLSTCRGSARDSNTGRQEHSDTPHFWSMLSVTLSPTFSSKYIIHSSLFSKETKFCFLSLFHKILIPIPLPFIMTIAFNFFLNLLSCWFPRHICKEFKKSLPFLQTTLSTLSEVEIFSKWPLDLQTSAAQALLRFFCAPGAEINLMSGNKSGKYTTENWAIFQFD